MEGFRFRGRQARKEKLYPPVTDSCKWTPPLPLSVFTLPPYSSICDALQNVSLASFSILSRFDMHLCSLHLWFQRQMVIIPHNFFFFPLLQKRRKAMKVNRREDSMVAVGESPWQLLGSLVNITISRFFNPWIIFSKAFEQSLD